MRIARVKIICEHCGVETEAICFWLNGEETFEELVGEAQTNNFGPNYVEESVFPELKSRWVGYLGHKFYVKRKGTRCQMSGQIPRDLKVLKKLAAEVAVILKNPDKVPAPEDTQAFKHARKDRINKKRKGKSVGRGRKYFDLYVEATIKIKRVIALVENLTEKIRVKCQAKAS